MRQTPVTERRNQNTRNIDRLSTAEMLQRMNEEDKKVPLAVEKEIPNIAEAVDVVTGQLRNGGRLFYLGAGTSGRLGVLDASECPPTFRSDPEQVQGIIAGGKDALIRSIEGAEDFEEDGAAALRERNVGKNDVVCGIATSGRTPYVLGGLKWAQSEGIPTIALFCNPVDASTVPADIFINPVVGPEVITGSTRMKAGTATKLVLNMITTGTMIKLGKVYGNLMVDLTAVNQKLVDRAQRIVMEVTGVDRDKARITLEQAEYKVKNALLMILGNTDYTESVSFLKQHDGVLADVLESVKS